MLLIGPRPCRSGAGALGNDALRAAVHLLARDPNWQVLSTPDPHAWDLEIYYAPEGLSYALHLERATATAASPERPSSAPTLSPGLVLQRHFRFWAVQHL